MRLAVLLLVAVALAIANPAPAQTFRENVDVGLVRVDVLATDAGGRPVRGLRAAQFTVRVDGRTVSIVGFEAPPEQTSSARISPAPPPPQGSSSKSEAPAPSAAPLRTSYVAFLVDETSSEQSNRQATLAELFRFLKSGLAPNTQLLFLRFNGAIRIECPWTSDPDVARRCAAATARHRAAPLLGMPGQLSGNSERGAGNLELEARDAIGHARNSVAGIFDALRLFPETAGRKSLYVVTDGAPFLAPAEIARDLIVGSNSSVSQGDPAERSLAGREAELDRDRLFDSLAWSGKRSASLLQEVARLAILRGIEIHPVRSAAHDFGGRVRTDRAFSDRATVRGNSSLDPRSGRGGNSLPTSDLAAGTVMEAIAESTGGEAVLSRRSFEERLGDEAAATEAAYVVTFRDPFAGDHRYHRIEIAAEGGAKLRYRRGYRVLDVRESLIEHAVNRLHVPADENPLGVRMRLDSLGLKGGLAEAEVTIAYPAPPQAGGKAGGPGVVQVFGTCAVRDGALSEPIDLSGAADPVSLGDSTMLVRSGRVRVKPGAYRWSFAIRDEQTGIVSYLTFDRSLP
ncbi:MAG: VWA domain-containing protein [Acidobacteriota bacterium]|nr:VWA domain-containing protein [Acidobacteriota bacterium]